MALQPDVNIRNRFVYNPKIGGIDEIVLIINKLYFISNI